MVRKGINKKRSQRPMLVKRRIKKFSNADQRVLSPREKELLADKFTVKVGKELGVNRSRFYKLRGREGIKGKPGLRSGRQKLCIDSKTPSRTLTRQVAEGSLWGHQAERFRTLVKRSTTQSSPDLMKRQLCIMYRYTTARGREMAAHILITFMIARELVRLGVLWTDVLLKRGLSTESFKTVLTTRNPVRCGISLETALQKLHLHNILVVHDTWFKGVLDLVTAWRAAHVDLSSIAQMLVFLTLFPSRDVLKACRGKLFNALPWQRRDVIPINECRAERFLLALLQRGKSIFSPRYQLALYNTTMHHAEEVACVQALRSRLHCMPSNDDLEAVAYFNDAEAKAQFLQRRPGIGSFTAKNIIVVLHHLGLPAHRILSMRNFPQGDGAVSYLESFGGTAQELLSSVRREWPLVLHAGLPVQFDARTSRRGSDAVSMLQRQPCAELLDFWLCARTYEAQR